MLVYRVAWGNGLRMTVNILYYRHSRRPPWLGKSGQRASQAQFRGFESHRVHARRDFLLNKKIISGKRELGIVDENRRALGMPNPMRDKK